MEFKELMNAMLEIGPGFFTIDNPSVRAEKRKRVYTAAYRAFLNALEEDIRKEGAFTSRLAENSARRVATAIRSSPSFIPNLFWDNFLNEIMDAGRSIDMSSDVKEALETLNKVGIEEKTTRLYSDENDDGTISCTVALTLPE